ncbi:MAG: hypothetical protein Q9198_000620 [Flavoplaca austrocitrina]
MTSPFSDLRYFQDKIHVLSVLSHAQLENGLPKAKRRRRTRRQSEQYIRMLDAISVLISANVDNGQDTATTFFRFPSHIRILWTLGGNASQSDSQQVIENVNDYLEEIRHQLLERNSLVGMFRYIIHECKPRILYYFQEILRCVARDSSDPPKPKILGSTEVRDWNQELQMLLRETYYFVEEGSWSDTLREIYAANFDLFVQRASSIDEATNCWELMDLLIYCYFLITDFGKTVPISSKLWDSLAAAASLWAACKDLRQYVVFAKRKHQLLWVEFEQLPTPPPQSVTHHVSPLTALKTESNDFFCGSTLQANLSTYNHISLKSPYCLSTIKTTTSIPHPELVIANHLYSNYQSQQFFHTEHNFPVGTSRPVCHWCAVYFDSIRMELASLWHYSVNQARNDSYTRAALSASPYLLAGTSYGHKLSAASHGIFRPDKEVVVSSIDPELKDSAWVFPADSPPEIQKQMEVMVDDEFRSSVIWLKELGEKSKEERDFDAFEREMVVGERKRKRKEAEDERKRELMEGMSWEEWERRRRQVGENVDECGAGARVCRLVEREVGDVVRWVWGVFDAGP